GAPNETLATPADPESPTTVEPDATQPPATQPAGDDAWRSADSEWRVEPEPAGERAPGEAAPTERAPAGAAAPGWLTPPPAGAWGAARLYRAIRPDREAREEIGPLAAGVAFVANPYVVVAGASQPVLLPWALLPWQLLCLVRALRQPPSARVLNRWKWPAAVALTFVALSGTNAGVVPVLQLVAVPVVVLVVRRTTGVSWSRALVVLARCGALIVAVCAYWLVPALSAVGAGTLV